jgi:hypothetical protein
MGIAAEPSWADRRRGGGRTKGVGRRQARSRPLRLQIDRGCPLRRRDRRALLRRDKWRLGATRPVRHAGTTPSHHPRRLYVCLMDSTSHGSICEAVAFPLQPRAGLRPRRFWHVRRRSAEPPTPEVPRHRRAPSIEALYAPRPSSRRDRGKASTSSARRAGAGAFPSPPFAGERGRA